MLDVLGIENHRIVLSEEDKNLHAEWKSAVAQKDFELADKFRAQLIEKGFCNALQEYNGTSLAYMGDAVMSLFVREMLLSKGYQKPNVLQKKVWNG